jgi:hypothetical protein
VALPLAAAIAVVAQVVRHAWLPSPATGFGPLVVRLGLLGLGCAGLYAAGVLRGRILPVEAVRSVLSGTPRTEML